MVTPSEKARRPLVPEQVERMKRVMAKLPPEWRERSRPALPAPVRSDLEALPQAVAQVVDPGEKSAPGTARDRRDTTQTPAAPPGRCATHFPAAPVAKTAVAPTARLPHARLQEEAD